MEFNISVVANIRDNRPQDTIITYDKLVKGLTTFPDEIIKKDQAKGFIAGHFKNKKRLTDNLTSRTLITLDLDYYNSDLTSLEALLERDLSCEWYIAYSTSSHTCKQPKIRIVVLLEKEIKTEDYRTVVLNFVDHLELKPFLDIDASTKPNQLMFLPVRSHDAYTPWSKVHEGQLLNPDYYCVDYGLTEVHSNLHSNAVTKTKERKVKPIADGTDTLLLAVKNTPLNVTNEEVTEVLKAYKASDTDYHSWLEVGMALSHQYACSDDGLKIWQDWSKLDDRYKKVEIEKQIPQKWLSFGESANPTTFATIMKKVNDMKLLDFNKKSKTKKTSKPIIEKTKFLHTKGEKFTPLNTIENFETLLKEYNISIVYDVILKRKDISFDGVIEKDLNVAQARLESLCIQNGMPHFSVSKYMEVTKSEVNSWRDWIESKPWDGVDRLEDFYNTVKVDENLEDIKKMYIKSWLMQMIHLSCLNDAEEGKMGRLVLVFQGEQRIGKTSWFKALCPVTHRKYLKEGMMLDTKDSMSVLACIQNVFVELGELGSTFKKSDSDNLKNFISSTNDVINVKYVANHVVFRRRTVFFASINDETFLQDTTGNTRYCILPVLECDYLHTVDMQQLYAQLYQYARKGESFNLSNESTKTQTSLNKKFENPSYLKEKFYATFDTERVSRENVMSCSMVLEAMGLMPSSIKRSTVIEMASVFKSLGYKQRKYGAQAWELPPRK